MLIDYCIMNSESCSVPTYFYRNYDEIISINNVKEKFLIGDNENEDKLNDRYLINFLCWELHHVSCVPEDSEFFLVINTLYFSSDNMSFSNNEDYVAHFIRKSDGVQL